MPKRPIRHQGEVAGYWLSQRPNSKVWYRTWFDAGTRQTRRASLGTDDLTTAELKLASWITRNVATKQADLQEVTLGRVLTRYFERHGQALVGRGSQRISLRMILAIVPEGMTVGRFMLDTQHQAVRALQAKGYAAGSIKRAFGAAKAAINWAWKNGELERPMPFLRLAEGPGRERVLSVAELARLWDTDMPDHLRTFLVLAIGTAGRPEALLQLTAGQCDTERRTINLNRPGRVQTKKRRPILPMAEWLAPWLAGAEGPIVSYRSNPVRKIAGAFQTMRDAAGFGPDVTAYTVRHSIATELAARGVPEIEIATVLGHSMPNIRTTGRYVHVAPDRLACARDALDDIAEDIGRLAKRPTTPTALRASCVPAAPLPTTQTRNRGRTPGGLRFLSGPDAAEYDSLRSCRRQPTFLA